MAQDKSVPQHIREDLATNDPDPEVRRTAIRTLPTEKAWPLAQKDGNKYVLISVADRSDATDDMVADAMRAGWEPPFFRLARRQDTTNPRLLSAMSKSKDGVVREAAAANPNTPVTDLRRLSRLKDTYLSGRAKRTLEELGETA